MRFKNRILLTVTLLFAALTVESQDLSKYRWNNRILLVVTSDTLAPNFRAQLAAIRSDPEGIAERRLITIQVHSSGYLEGDSSRKWIRSPELYTKHHRSENTLEVVLIGLDGSVKHRADRLIPLSQIYSWIDAMPMRREEIRQKQKSGNMQNASAL